MAEEFDGTIAKPDDAQHKGKKVKIKLTKGEKKFPKEGDKREKTTSSLHVDFLVEPGAKSLFGGERSVEPLGRDDPLEFTFTKTKNGGEKWDVGSKGDKNHGPWFHVVCPKPGTNPYVGHIELNGPEPGNDIAIDEKTQTKITEWLKKAFPAAKEAEKHPVVE